MATELQVLPEPHLLTSSRLITVAKWHFDRCSPTLLDRSRDGELDLEKCWHLRERFSQSCDVIHLCVCHTLRFDSSALFFFSFSWNVRSSLDCSNHSHPRTHTHRKAPGVHCLPCVVCYFSACWKHIPRGVFVPTFTLHRATIFPFFA